MPVFIILLVSAILSQYIAGAPNSTNSSMPRAQRREVINCGKRWKEGLRFKTRPNLKETPSWHILGNHSEADPHGWPWTLYLQIHQKINNTIQRSGCGAVLVQVCQDTTESDIALTAAHCVTYRNRTTNRTDVIDVNGMHVFGGIHALNKLARGPHRRATVKSVYLPFAYNDSNPYDIAILVLNAVISNSTDQATPMGKKIHPACLPTGYRGKNQRPWLMTTCYVAGWGETVENGSVNSPVLQQSRYRVLSPHQCLTALNRSHLVMDHLFTPRKWNWTGITMDWPPKFCAVPFGISDRFHSSGDSGGPLMCKDHLTQRWILQGVLNEGIEINNVLFLSAITSVRGIWPWLSFGIERSSSVCRRCRTPIPGKCSYVYRVAFQSACLVKPYLILAGISSITDTVGEFLVYLR